MKNSIFVFSLFLSELFMTFYAIMGMEYVGSETTPAFTVTIMVIGAITLFFLVKETNSVIRTRFFNIFVVVLPLLLFFNSVIEAAGNNYMADIIYTYTKVSLGYIVPISITAIYMAKDGLTKYSKQIHLAMLLITLATLMSIRNSVADISLGFGGANYQTLSYYAALAFCLNLCYILFKEDLEIYSFLQNKYFYYFSYIFLVAQLAGCLISGGRGGFVFLAVCSIYMLLRTGKLSKFFSVAIFVLLLGIIVSSLGSDNRLLNIINVQMERTFSYVSKSGIDMSQTSDRDVVYAQAQDYIGNHLLTGGGLFTSRIEFGGYPHNFFLEVLMQGGILFCVFWIIVLLFALKRMHFLVIKKHDYLLLPIVMYPVIMLLFSGTYQWTPLFWFFLVYSFTRANLLNNNIVQ